MNDATVTFIVLAILAIIFLRSLMLLYRKREREDVQKLLVDYLPLIVLMVCLAMMVQGIRNAMKFVRGLFR